MTDLSGLTAVITGYLQLLIFRVLFGMGEGPMGTTTNKAITPKVRELNADHQGKVNGNFTDMKGMHSQLFPVRRALPHDGFTVWQCGRQAWGGFPFMFVGGTDGSGFHSRGS